MSEENTKDEVVENKGNDEAQADKAVDAEPVVTIAEEGADEAPVAEWGDWEEWKNPQGISYFYNKKTEESVWEDPRTASQRDLMVKQQSEKPKVKPPAFLPKEAWEQLLKKKVNSGSLDSKELPTLEEAIETIREEIESTRRNRGESNWTDASDLTERDTIHDDEKTRRMRALLRVDSAQSWDGGELAALHDEMHEQLEALTAQARASGMVIPKLHKRAPRRPPPGLPPPSLAVPKKPNVTEEKSLSADEGSEEEKLDRPKETFAMKNATGKLLPKRPPRPNSNSPNLLGSRTGSTRSIGTTVSIGTAPGGDLVQRQASLFVNNAPYTVIADWTPEPNSRTKIAIARGDGVLITKQGSSGWWLGKNLRTNESGYFPGSYLEKSEPSLSLGQHSSSGGPPPRPGKAPPTLRPTSLWKAKLMAKRSENKQKKQSKRKGSFSYSNKVVS